MSADESIDRLLQAGEQRGGHVGRPSRRKRLEGFACVRPDTRVLDAKHAEGMVDEQECRGAGEGGGAREPRECLAVVLELLGPAHRGARSTG